MEIEPGTIRRATWVFVILLVAATFAAYQPIWRAGFIWDDNLYVVENPALHLSDGWWKVWCMKAVDYVPAVSSVWWLEWHWWQNNPPAFHLVNLLWHAGNALLLWRVLLRLRIPGALLAAAIFALHPVNVETAAWVAEQKNTQALFFFLATIWCHLRFEETRLRRWYGAALAAFFLALACKTAVAPLPIILLVIAWWRRGTVTRSDVWRSIPFFLLAGLGAAVALWIQSGGQGQTPLLRASFAFRLARAGDAIWLYLDKDFLPVHLASIYPKWTINSLNPVSYLPALAFAGFLIVCWRQRHGWGRPLLFCLGYFALMLLPALGFFDITLMRYAWVADHWQYFAIIGPICLFSAVIHAIARKNITTGIILEGVVLTACGLLTWNQAKIYQSGEIFWAEFLRVNQPALAANNEGRALLAHGKTDEAMALFRKAIELQPALALPYNSIGSVLLQQGRPEEAAPMFEEALSLRPEFPEARENLAGAFLATGRTEEALVLLERNATLQPQNAAAQYKMGQVLLQVRLPGDAQSYLTKALAIRTNFPEADYALGNAFEETGRLADAIAHYQNALQQRRDFIPACNNLAWLLATAPDPKLRNGAKAIELAQHADHLSNGQNPVVLGTLAAAFAEAGRFPDAIDASQRALSLANAQHDATLADAIRAQMEFYHAGKPLRQSAKGAATVK